MWRRSSGWSPVAALIVFAGTWYIPGADLAGRMLAQILPRLQSAGDDFEMLDRELRRGEPAAPTGPILDRPGPSIFDGFVPTRRNEL